MFAVPFPVISRSLLLTWARPSTWPTSCAMVHCVAALRDHRPGAARWVGGTAVERRDCRTHEVHDDVVGPGVVAVGEKLVLLGCGLAEQTRAPTSTSFSSGKLRFSVETSWTVMPTLAYKSRMRCSAVAMLTFGAVSILAWSRTVGTPLEPPNPRGHRQFEMFAG